MTNDDGGDSTAAQPPPPTGNPAFEPRGYPPPDPGGSTPPPGYPPWSYGSPPGYTPQPGYGPSPYPQYPGYPTPMGPPPALKPGIIPLRPLGLGDIFNAAFSYIRVNPKATLGLTTVVVVVTQIIVLIMTAVVPLILFGQGDISQVEGEVSAAEVIGMLLALLGVVLTIVLSPIVLSGMLTVVVGRAVFGAPITIREAWDRMRGRLLALIGLTLLEGLGYGLLFALVAVVIAVTFAASPGLGVLVGVPFGLGAIVLSVYLWIMLSFAPVAIVLERLPVFTAIGRSFALVRGSFWRVFGISILGRIVAFFITLAVSAPFTIGGEVLRIAFDTVTGSLVAAAVDAVGAAIGQIITAPFIAGIVVLLYTDRRMRAEAFDLVLQTGAATATQDSADATDELWLVRHH